MPKAILRPGDLILFHTKGFSPISFGIRQLTQSFWNHIGIYIEEINTKSGFVIEALGKGVCKTSIDTYINNKNYILRVVKIKEEAFKDKEEYDKGIELIISRMSLSVGKKYDWWAIVWLGIKYLSRAYWNKGAKYVPQRFNPFQSRYKFFCSELVCENCYNISSKYPYLFQGKTKQDCSTTTPKDIGKSFNVKHLWGKDIA